MFATSLTTGEFPLVVKADVQGSVEAIVRAAQPLERRDQGARAALRRRRDHRERRDAGGASGAPIIGFNVRPNAKARELVERNKVEICTTTSSTT